MEIPGTNPSRQAGNKVGLSATELNVWPLPPFFLLGVHRSGTTLLRYMLNSSPRLYIPPESDFIPRFFGRNPTGTLTPERTAQILHIIFTRYRFVREWQGDPPDPDAFWRAMPAPTPAGFLHALYGEYMRQHGAVRWGDKTPIYTSYIGLLARIFPEAQFVHLIRDGRDVALSMVNKWGKQEFHIDPYFAARSWVRRIRQAQAASAGLPPERYYELRYEDLVAAPERELRALCDFLGEPYTPEMAEPHRLARRDIPPDGFHAPVRQPPSPKRVGRWRHDMSPADARLVQRVAGSLLAELGYEVEDLGPMSASERARYAALAVKYTVLQAGRRLLQTVGVFPPN